MEASDEWEELFRVQAPKLWNALLLATGNPEVASDAVSEAFAQGMRRGDALLSPVNWIWKVAFKIAVAEMRVQSLGEVPEIASRPTDTDATLDLLAALARLSLRQRQSIVLADFSGYSHHEVAAMIGSTAGAVAVHVFRARARMRDLMETDGG